MSIFQILGVGFIGLVLYEITKSINKDFAPFVSVATVILLSYFAIEVFSPIIKYARGLAASEGAGAYTTVMLRTVGVSLLCRTASDICIDSGASSIGEKIDFVGRAAIAICIFPVLKNVIESAKDFLM